MIVAALAGAAALVATGFDGCGKKEAARAHSPSPTGPQPPRAVVKRVPCKLRFGPLAAALEVDLGEVKEMALDAKQLYAEIVRGEPGTAPPPASDPVVMVVNKIGNKITYFQLAANVKEVRLRSQDAKDVELVVKNQNPLSIELWVSTDKPVDLFVEFKDGTPSPRS
jgi:hypothetical protein